MQVNDVIELEIESMSFGPAAVARYSSGEGRVVVFVEGAIPHEKIEARLKKKYKNYWEAELVQVLTPSPDRIAPPCPVFERCGGCQWQFMSYDAQIAAKKEILIHQLHRATRLPIDEIQAKLQVHPAKSPFGYRARLQIHGDKKGIGFFGRRSHEVIHTDQCLVAHPDIQNAWTEFLTKRPLAELASATGQYKVEWTRTDSGQIKEALNRKHGALGFTQVNSEQNEVLVSLVQKFAVQTSARQVLVDLYGGDGNLSRNLVDTFACTICVDSHNEGRDPSEIKTTRGFTLIRARTEEFLVNQYWRDWEIDQLDAIIADPPRAGLEGAGPRIANLNAERVVLVSCEPSTLARDLTSFLDAYAIENIELVDMFPQTFHLETVVSLRRKNGKST